MRFSKSGSDWSRYEAIVMGAGSAGCAAARALHDGGVRTLLIEAGGRNQSIPVRMPGASGLTLTSDRTNYKFFGAPEHDERDQVYQPRGRGLGGSSAVNGMNWVRGNARDYDAWEEHGATGWSFERALPVFKSIESFDGDPRWRGQNGPVSVERSPADAELFQAFLKSGEQAGFPLNEDHNASSQFGLHRTQRNVANGERVSAAAAFLKDHPGPDVVTGIDVLRLLVTNGRCEAIQISQDGHRHTIAIEGDIFLSCGAIATPRLLMLSGVGNPEDLRALGVPVVAPLCSVGQRLLDHPAICLDFGVNDGRSSLAHRLTPLGRLAVGAEWLATRRGLGASNHFEAGGFLASRYASRDWPDVQVETVAMKADFGPERIDISSGFQAFVSLQRPKSHGYLKLKSSDPSAPPHMVFNHLGAEDDRKALTDGLEQVLEILSSAPMSETLRNNDLVRWRGMVGSRPDEVFHLAESNYHPCGTVPMGENPDESACSPDGRVHGCDNLYIADASLMPTIPTANLNAPTMMIGRMIAERYVALRSLH